MEVIIINLYTGVKVILHLLVKKLALGHIPEEKNQNLYQGDLPMRAMPSSIWPREKPEGRGQVGAGMLCFWLTDSTLEVKAMLFSAVERKGERTNSTYRSGISEGTERLMTGSWKSFTHTYTHTHHTHANVSKVLNAPIRPRKRGMCRCILAR